MHVIVGGRSVRVRADRSIGKGGEADVYALGRAQALKLFKPPSHPDFAASVDDRTAAERRIAEQQRKLREFPVDLPGAVIVPEQLAYDANDPSRIVGYAMKRVPRATPLFRLAEPRNRKLTEVEQVLTWLRSVGAALTAIHERGVVVGDFNDFNLLAQGDDVFFIDADSFQFGRFPCRVFTERFVDPLLAGSKPTGLAPRSPMSKESDWYAYTVLVFTLLLGVSPYGGVYRPARASRRVNHNLRPLRRITLFDDDVVRPRASLPLATLADDLLSYFRAVFEDDVRGPFPMQLLGVRFSRCGACGAEFARRSCPVCALTVQLPPKQLRQGIAVDVLREFPKGAQLRAARVTDGAVECLIECGGEVLSSQGGRWTVVGGARYELASRPVVVTATWQLQSVDGRDIYDVVDAWSDEPAVAANEHHVYWVSGGRLMRDAAYSPVEIGRVLSGQTRLWVGARFGVGFYRAGTLTRGFCFHAERQHLDDSVALPQLTGEVVDAQCTVGDRLAWLVIHERRAASSVAHLVVIARDGAVVYQRTAPGHASDWMLSVRGAVAVDSTLLVPTDRGVVRVQIDNGRVRSPHVFAGTVDWVDAESRLFVTREGLVAVSARRVVRLSVVS